MKGARRPKDVPAGMRWCGRGAGHFAPIAEFGPYQGRADGLNSVCRDCARAYARAHWVKHHAAAAHGPPPGRYSTAPYPKGTPIRVTKRTSHRLVTCALCERPGHVHEGYVLCEEHAARLDLVVQGRVPRLTRVGTLVPKPTVRHACKRCALPVKARVTLKSGLCGRCANSAASLKHYYRKKALHERFARAS